MQKIENFLPWLPPNMDRLYAWGRFTPNVCVCVCLSGACKIPIYFTQNSHVRYERCHLLPKTPISKRKCRVNLKYLRFRLHLSLRAISQITIRQLFFTESPFWPISANLPNGNFVTTVTALPFGWLLDYYQSAKWSPNCHLADATCERCLRKWHHYRVRFRPV